MSTVRSGRGRPAKRGAKRELLLDEAARRINTEGVGSLILNDIAEQVGLSRNTLYYYVADKSDLVFRCYLRACEATADSLAAADDADAPAAEQIRRFIDGELAFGQPHQAVLSDVDFLPEPQRRLIREQQARNVEALRGMIAGGVAAGDFRSCDTQTAAQCLIGMVSWARLSAGWYDHRDSRATRRRSGAAIADVFLHGFSARPDARTRFTLDIDALVARPFNAFDRRQTNELKIGQLIAAASRLFNRRGIDGVSLEEIGASVGATRGAVYHYFDDKADLVVRCYRRAFEIYDKIMATANAQGRSGFERALLTLHLNVQAQASPLSPLMLQPGNLALPQEDLNRFTKATQRLRLASVRNLKRGLVDGSCRAGDFSAMADAAAGIFLWLPKWLPEDYPLSPLQIADEISGLMGLGIEAKPAGERRSA
jgi:AcrR family transcriptional regulator